MGGDGQPTHANPRPLRRYGRRPGCARRSPPGRLASLPAPAAATCRGYEFHMTSVIAEDLPSLGSWMAQSPRRGLRLVPVGLAAVIGGAITLRLVGITYGLP